MEFTVYQDLDPLGHGSGEWYGYVSSNGHVIENFGGFATREEAVQEGQRRTR